MLKTTSLCLLLLGCAAVVYCMDSADLPPAITDEQLQEILMKIVNKNESESSEEEERRELEKRGGPAPDNSHWCCNKRDPGQIGPRRQVTKVRVVTRVIPAGGSIKCGFLGLSRCASSRRKTVTVTQYYHEYEYPTIPAPQWVNGCPDPNIVCCNGYVFYTKLGNCLTFSQLENILIVVKENREALSLLDEFLGK